MADRDPNAERFNDIVADIGMEFPGDLERGMEAIDNNEWNSLVRDLQDRQSSVGGVGFNSVVDWTEIKQFQARFNALDPKFVSGERKFGQVDVAFNGLMVVRIDRSGRQSIEYKSATRGASKEVLRAAQCNVEFLSIEPTGHDQISKIALQLEKIYSQDLELLQEYFEEPTAEVYVPASNLVEI